MHTDLLEAGAEPALGLCFSDEWLQEAEPDTSAWLENGQLGQLGEPVEHLEYGLPLGEEGDALAVPAWNLGASPLRRAAAAVAFVPLLSIAEPAFAAPPTSAVVSGPSEAPPTTEPSVWEALVEHRVVLSLKDGSSFRGTVLSVTNDVLVCAHENDGLMVVVDATQISSVHVEGLPGNPAPKKLQNGDGLIVLGSIATAIGGALGIATLVVGAACLDGYQGYVCPYVTVPTAVVSVVNLSVGIPLLVTGLRKRKHFREVTQGATAPVVSTFLTPGRTGAMAGFGVRF
jgi:hypothetical protein